MISIRRKLLLLVSLLLLALAITACGNRDGIAEEISGEVSDIPGEIPQQYRDLKNPLTGDPDALAHGHEAYQALCSQCHGEQGQGDGAEAVGFSPGPGDLTRAEIAGTSDGYLFWRITDGGVFEPFKSNMPAWGTLLSETELWELVSYLRELSG
jgi:mono/diheme cytochrome c family protein